MNPGEWLLSPTGVYVLVSLVPPVATFLYLWAQELWDRIPGTRSAWLMLVGVCGAYAIACPPKLPGYLAIICGPGAVIHVLRAIDLGLILDVGSLQRLRKHAFTATELFIWEPRPPPCTIHRGLWILDLMTSIRGIGWSHGPREHLPASTSPSVRNRHPSPETLHSPSELPGEWSVKGKYRAFLTGKAAELAMCYLWLDFYQSIISRCDIWEEPARLMEPYLPQVSPRIWSLVLTPWVRWVPTKVSIYASIQLSCSALAFVDVGLLDNDPWRYPPLFGSSRAVLVLSFPGIWGSWWHDLFRPLFLRLAGWITATRKLSQKGEYFLTLCVPFLCYAALHASLSYSTSHDLHASVWVAVFGCIQPLVIMTQHIIRAHSAADARFRRGLELAHALVALGFFYCTFGMLLDNPGVLYLVRTYPVPFSLWRGTTFDFPGYAIGSTMYRSDL